MNGHGSQDLNGLLCFAREPGGAEVISAFLKEMAPHSYFLIGKDYACDIFAGKGLNFVPYTGGSMAALCHYLNAIQEVYPVRAAVTSAASMPEQDMTEKYIWKWAVAVGIPSIALLDQWQNYRQRFSGPDQKLILGYLPDRICVMDRYAVAKMRCEGIPQEKIVVTGHPGLADLRKKKEAHGISKDGHIRRALKIGFEKRLLLFVSEPYSIWPIGNIGYNEVTILREFFLFLNHRLSEKHTLDDLCVVIKLHPKNALDDFSGLIEEFSALLAKARVVFVQSEFTKESLLQAADMVIGMASIMLMEAVVLGLPTISIQVGAVKTDLCEAVNQKLIPLVTDRKTMKTLLTRLLDEPHYQNDYQRRISEYEISMKPVERISEVVSALICRKEI